MGAAVGGGPNNNNKASSGGGQGNNNNNLTGGSGRGSLPPGAYPAGGGGGGGGGLGAQVPLGFDCVRLSRRLNVCITGTLGNFYADGHSAATWKPLDGKTHRIFGHGGEVVDVVSSGNALRNAYIVACRLLEYRSTFPVPLGVSMSCIPNNELTETGERFAFTALPLSSNTHPYTLFEADASQSEGIAWRKAFPEYTDGNLETHNILEVQGCPYVFVHEKHPAVHLLSANPDILGKRMEDNPKIDGEWFKLSKQVLNTACQTLRSKILSRISFNDLNLFQVQLKRIDAKDWTEIGEVLQEHITDREERARVLMLQGAAASSSYGAAAGLVPSSSSLLRAQQHQGRGGGGDHDMDCGGGGGGGGGAGGGGGGGDRGSMLLGGDGSGEMMGPSPDTEFQSVLDKPYSFMARIELTYEIPH